MNARQRRKDRRQRGIRPPYRCFWCRANGEEHWVSGCRQACPGCGSILRPMADMTAQELAREAYARGLTMQFSITRPPSIAAGRLLIQRIREISEARWCASWLLGCENTLWAEIQEGAETDLSPDAVEELRALADLAGGWPAWSIITGRAKILPWAEWMARVEEDPP